MYSIVCLVSACRFTVISWLYCITTIPPFIRRSQGWSFRSTWVLDHSQQKCAYQPNLPLKLETSSW